MHGIKGSKNKCQDKVWCCKPKLVDNIDIKKIDLLYSEIELGNISQNAERFDFYKEINISIDESIPNSADIERLHMFFGLFEINCKSVIENGKLTINYPKDQRKHGDLKIFEWEFILLFEKNIYSVNIWRDAHLSGLLYIPNNKNVVVIKLTRLNTEHSIIKREKDASLFYPIWLEEFKDHHSTDTLNMYAVVNKSDVTEIISSKLEKIKTISTCKNMEVIEIIANGDGEEKKELKNTLKAIPKILTLKIRWRTDSWFLMDECFWIEIFKHKQIEFMSEGDWRVLINCEGQELDQNNILKSIIEVSVYHYKLKIPIYQISEIISITEIEFKNKYSK